MGYDGHPVLFDDLQGWLAAAIFRGMYELTEENAVDYLKSAGLLTADVPANCELLAWGVSNMVFRISPESGEDFVIKQSREQLRTKADWFSRLDRIWREIDFLKVLEQIFPAGVVPRVLYEERDNYLFAMEAIEADHTVWKATLLRGETDCTIAATLGDYLSTIHRKTANDQALRDQFGDTEVFSQLRVDPFYRRIVEVHPVLGPSVGQLITEMFETNICLVHADFSPKNILITSQGISLVDFETGHYGDPAFDLGFFLSHLLLKTVLHADRYEQYLELTQTFWERYTAGLGELITDGPFAECELERRTIGHLAGCMLARIDGKSTVDYLPESSQQNLVRDYCLRLFLEPPERIETAFGRLREQLLQN